MKYLIVIPVCMALWLSSCSTEQSTDFYDTAKDGYVFHEKQFERFTMTVEVVIMRNEQEQQHYFRNFGNHWDKIAGYSEINEGADVCKIYIKDAAWNYQPEVIGHEMSHCIWGKWHKKGITIK